MWDWTTKDLDAVAAIGATWSTMTGYVHGDLYDAEGGGEMVRTARLSVEAAKKLGCPRLVVHGAELDGSRNGLPFRPQDVTTGQMWLNAYRTLNELADLGEANDVVFCLENLNLYVDHLGTPFGKAEDTLTLVSTLDRPGVRMMLDLYHAQIGEGNLIDLCAKSGTTSARSRWPMFRDAWSPEPARSTGRPSPCPQGAGLHRCRGARGHRVGRPGGGPGGLPGRIQRVGPGSRRSSRGRGPPRRDPA